VSSYRIPPSSYYRSQSDLDYYQNKLSEVCLLVEELGEELNELAKHQSQAMAVARINRKYLELKEAISA